VALIDGEFIQERTLGKKVGKRKSVDRKKRIFAARQKKPPEFQIPPQRQCMIA
jgi:hypothetical protein